MILSIHTFGAIVLSGLCHVTTATAIPGNNNENSEKLTELWTDVPRTVATVDPVDCDNFPLPVSVLRQEGSSKNAVAVVLERRGVNFGWNHWAETGPSGGYKNMQQRIFAKIKQAQQDGNSGIPKDANPFSYMIRPPQGTEKWLESLDEEEKKWMQPDKHVPQHSDVYMEISRIRFQKFARSYDTPTNRYHIFTQAERDGLFSGIQGPQHVHDWSWDLDKAADSDISKCKSVESSEPYSDARGDCISKALEAFIGRYHEEQSLLPSSERLPSEPTVLDPKTVEQQLHEYFEKAMPGSKREYKYLVGGPMTVLYDHYMESPKTVRAGVVMLTAFSRRSIVLPTQFNQNIDDNAAIKMLKAAQSGELPLWVTATEIAKNEHWQFEIDEEISGQPIFAPGSGMDRLIRNFSAASGLKVTLFDLIVGLAPYHVNLLPAAAPAVFSQDAGPGTWVDLSLADPSSGSNLYVFGLGLVSGDSHNRVLSELVAALAKKSSDMKKLVQQIFAARPNGE